MICSLFLVGSFARGKREGAKGRERSERSAGRYPDSTRPRRQALAAVGDTPNSNSSSRLQAMEQVQKSKQQLQGLWLMHGIFG